MEKPHKKLDVWKLSMDLACRIYRATEVFPRGEQYSLLELATHLEYLRPDRWNALDEQMVRIDKMLTGLIRHQRSQGAKV